MPQSLPLILVAAVVAAAAGATTAALVGGGSARAGELPSAHEALERMADTLAELTARQESLARSIEDLRAASALVTPAGDTRVPVGEIDDAVARWMRENGGRGAEGAGDAEVEPEEGDRLAEALAILTSGELDELEVQKLWRELAAEGLTDEVVAAFERRAEERSNDPDAQVELGGIYLNKIFEVGSSPEAGVWATKADRAFDRALDLDEVHWEARFSKAVSLSFWPPVFGKQGEAIRNFEILVGQQASGPLENRYAQTHLLLGNMYQQIGEKEKAFGAWRKGLGLFPDDEDLASQIELFGGP